MNNKYLKSKFILKLMLQSDKYSGDIFRTNIFKKNFKKITRGHQINFMNILVMIMWIRKGLPMPPSFHKHYFKDMDNLCDVHINPDLVLLYRITDHHIHLINIGSHSDLF